MTVTTATNRLQSMTDWLAACGHPAIAEPTIASADASRRQYWRVRTPAANLIVMDEPPPTDAEPPSSIPPFLAVQQRLHDRGVAVPEVLAHDEGRGFVLLEDLGDTTLMQWLADHPADAHDSRLCQAVAMLPAIAQAATDDLPPFDRAALQTEMDLLPTWYLAGLQQRQLSAEERQRWQAACDRIVDRLLAMPQVFVHRDYHSRNLMAVDDRLVTIDFQDAVVGPLPYDLVSLLRDSYVDWPLEQVAAMQAHFCRLAKEAGLAIGDAERFRTDFAWVAVQRHLKVLGIFARLSLRDGKHRYLDDLPLTWRHLQWALDQLPELDDLRQLLAASAPDTIARHSA